MIAMKWRLVKNHIALCKNCKTRFAKILQDEGDYCLIEPNKGWQLKVIITLPSSLLRIELIQF